MNETTPQIQLDADLEIGYGSTLAKVDTNIHLNAGIQASSNKGGELRHLRLTTEEMTITTFPARSDQAVVIHAIAVDRNKPVAQASNPPIKP